MPTLKELKKACGTPKKGDPWREKLARFISIRITWLLINVFPKITPNQVTIPMLIFGIASAVLFMFGQYAYTLAGVVVYHLYLILDACDGEVARYKKVGFEKGKRGIYLDYLGHVIINPLILIGIAIGAFFSGLDFIPSYWFLIIGGVTAYSMFINNFLKLKKYEMYIDKGEFKVLEKMHRGFKSQDRRKNFIMDELWQFFRIMTFNSILVFGVLNIMPYLVLVNGVVFPLQMLKRLYSEVKNA